MKNRRLSAFVPSRMTLNCLIKYRMETWLSGRKRLTANEVGVYTPRGFESHRLRNTKKRQDSFGVFWYSGKQLGGSKAGAMREFAKQGECREAGSRKISVRKFICDRIPPSPIIQKSMHTYLFYGKILPERAQLSLEFTINFYHPTTKNKGNAEISIVLNQMATSVYTDDEWNIFDLRNVVKNIIQSNLAMIGYLKGFAYDLEITRVLNPKLKINYVFGIDIPVIAENRESINIKKELESLRKKTHGEAGVFLNRCFKDFMSAMKNAEDTGFYCYRSLESLRLHCAHTSGLIDQKKEAQWNKFREISQVSENKLREIEVTARGVRHGEMANITDSDRAQILKNTWDIIESYIKRI